MKFKKNEKTAEIVGVSFGDGSLTKRKDNKLRFQMRGNIEEREYYDKHIKPLFDNSLGTMHIANYSGKKPYYGISSDSQEICKRLNLLGIPIGPKKELSIPQWIKQEQGYLRNFLRGIVDTDGSVFCGRDYNYPRKRHGKLRMSIGSTSSILISDIGKSLKDFGLDIKYP